MCRVRKEIVDPGVEGLLECHIHGPSGGVVFFYLCCVHVSVVSLAPESVFDYMYIHMNLMTLGMAQLSWVKLVWSIGP